MANRGGVTEICMPRPSAAARMRCGEMVRAAKMRGAVEMASAKMAAAEMSTAEMAATKVAAAAVPTSTVPASTMTCNTANRRRGRKRRRKQDNGNSYCRPGHETPLRAAESTAWITFVAIKSSTGRSE